MVFSKYWDFYIPPKKEKSKQVLATAGGTHSGGEDFDQSVMTYFVKLMQSKYKTDISKDKKALQRLRREIEKAKRTLSTMTTAQIEVFWISSGIDVL